MNAPAIPPESGLLLVDKPTDWTSHDVVNCIRRRFKIKKVGHCGTLDPFATGLLLILMGKGTKLQNALMSTTKAYEGTIHLGITTTTLDREGDILTEQPVEDLTETSIMEVTNRFIGDIEQIPPMTSAVKVNGQRLYKLARQGKEIEREPRSVTIYDLSITQVNLPFLTFSTTCSKGTYIRTLAEDIGTALGCGAHLKELRRTGIGDFTVAHAHTMDTIKRWESEDLLSHRIPYTSVLDMCKESVTSNGSGKDK
jgi:tRNA pseudouridine55 synthase